MVTIKNVIIFKLFLQLSQTWWLRVIGTGIAIVGLFNTPCHNIGWHRLCLMLSICLLFYSFISLFIFFLWRGRKVVCSFWLLVCCLTILLLFPFSWRFRLLICFFCFLTGLFCGSLIMLVIVLFPFGWKSWSIFLFKPKYILSFTSDRRNYRILWHWFPPDWKLTQHRPAPANLNF